MNGCSDKLLLLQAHVDGELDAANALALEAHLRSCTACVEELARIGAVRRLLADAELGHAAPAALRARVEALVEKPPVTAAPARPSVAATAPRRGMVGLAGDRVLSLGRNLSSGLLIGLAASAALVFAMPQFLRPGIEDQLISSHIRSLSLDSHLTDIATSNRHVVKPWFNGKIDFAPRVPELAAQGFPLVGGRLDVVDGHEVAVIVYKRRLHTINLFVRPAPRLALPVGIAAKRDGYSIVQWSDAGLEYWAVSDIDLDELQLFRQAFQGRPSL